ncbi:hypothetical protein [Kitasatospora sp. NPDC058046]|uniref:hypothetical protein n=1 Tax=Kitasatospora sp. NPDC058046 TaxID=3346312 RepID=UPI0036DA4BA1
MAEETNDGKDDLHAQCAADYGTPEQREDRKVKARDQRAGAQAHGNESGGSWGRG